jgi:2-methylcitrate dehydratase PrpD
MYTRALANYAASLKYEDLPKEVIEQVKFLTLHTLGVAIAACPTFIGKDVLKLGAEMGGEKEESTILGFGKRVSCLQAAMINGTLADTLDWEDCSWTGHPSADVIPAALAVAEKTKASGRDFITSVVAGYEVYQRIAMAIQPSRERFQQQGWGLTSWGIFGSAMSAARLMNASEDEMAVTISLAGALTPVINFKVHLANSVMYHYQYGLTCKDGIISAMLAKNGMNGPYDTLDKPMAYWQAMSDIHEPNWYTKGLGKEYLLMDILVKRWPANMWIQQPLDILNTMIMEDGLKTEDIARINVYPSITKKTSSRMIYRPEGYQNMFDAEFSIPYCLAVLLLKLKPGADWYTPDLLANKKLLEIAAKVKDTGPVLDLYDAFKMYQAGTYPEMSLEIITNGGRKLKRAIPFPKGHPKNRLTLNEHTECFNQAASAMLSQNKIEKAVDKILKLEAVMDMNEIGSLMHD